MKIKISWREGECERDIKRGTTAAEVVKELGSLLPYPIFTCIVDGEPGGLDRKINHSCAVKLLDLRDKTADLAFQSSLVFMLIKAVHDVIGQEVGVEVHNALSKGVYITVKRRGLTRNMLTKIENRMRELQQMDIPLQHQVLRRSEVIRILKERGMMDNLRLLDNVPDLDRVEVYHLGNEIGVFYSPLAPSTGCLKPFELRRYKNGIILRFPSSADPLHIPPYADDPILYAAFAEETHWGRLMNVNNCADLNRRILNHDEKDLILLSEALHEKKTAEIAAAIKKSGKRIILVAGPSSSGKTTFSKRLCIQLRVAGLRPLYLGTDDYFVEREETPLGPDGKKNFEDLSAVDVPLFEKQMNALLAGKLVDIPTFDFVEGHKIFGKRKTRIDDSQPIVIEGIHALNPELTKDIPDEQKFRIYISPLTSLSLDIHNRISTTDARMLRRIVRDYQFRGRDAAETIRSWPSVRDGEVRNIFPYSNDVDLFFNSHCLYELAVLKKYARPLLEEIKKDQPEYPDAQRMLNFLRFFVEMDSDMIPNNSIMREFIGGSILAE